MDARAGASWRGGSTASWCARIEPARRWRRSTGTPRRCSRSYRQAGARSSEHARATPSGPGRRADRGPQRLGAREAVLLRGHHRALDSAQRLLRAVSGGQARRPRSTGAPGGAAHHVRRAGAPQTRRQSIQVEGTPKAGLKPWREVITPHPDVATGRYAEAEFAADLAQVQRGDGVGRIRRSGRVLPPHLPDRRAARLLEGAIRRLSGHRAAIRWSSCRPTSAAARPTPCSPSPPVSGTAGPKTLPGVDQIDRVGVGRAICRSPTCRAGRHGALAGRGRTRGGARDAYALGRARLAARRRRRLQARRGFGPQRRQPGLQTCCRAASSAAAPCLILIDEWVAFVRQLYAQAVCRPAASIANITFAQALTEAVKATPGALLVASPACLADRDRRRGRRGGARPAQEHLRPDRELVAPGERRRGLRDRPPAPVPADGRARGLRRARRRRQGVCHHVPRQRRLVPSQNAAKATTGGGWRRPIRSIPSCSTG